MRDADRTKRQTFARLAGVLGVVGTALSGAPSEAAEMSSAVAALYTSVSIYPPSAKSMTVCYGFVCRRREILDFTPGDRKALTQIMAAGRASAVAERAAVQKAVVWFDRRMGPILGTNKRVRQSGFPLLRRQAQLRLLGHHPQHHQPVTGAAGLGSAETPCDR